MSTVTAPKPKKMRETSKHIDAFEAWYENGRNFTRTSQNCTISRRSLFTWADDFDWHERADARDIEVKRLADAEAVKERADRQRRRRQAAELLTARGVEWMRTFKIENARDAIMAIKIGIEIERKEDGIPDWVMFILNADNETLDVMAKQLGLSLPAGDSGPLGVDSYDVDLDETG